MESDLTLNAITTCALYKSCKNVYFVKELGSMSTPEGFFNSMASKGISNGHYLMNFSYNQTGGVESKVYPCNKVYEKKNSQGQTVDPDGFPLYKNQGNSSIAFN